MNYRNKANITLVAVLVSFVIVAVIRHAHPTVFFYRLVYFVLEAALVGGLADWFAVTALFRKPLGFPYHTALIPRNRQKVIKGVSSMVEGDLLSKAAIRAKLTGIRFDRLIIDLLEANPSYKQTISRRAGVALADYLSKLDQVWAVNKLEGLIRSQLQKFQAGAGLQKGIAWLMDEGYAEKWLDYGLEELIKLAQRDETREKLYSFLQAQKQEQTKDNWLKSLVAGLLESTDSLNLEEAAMVLQSTLLENLQELKSPAHPVRLKIKEILLLNLSELDADPAWFLTTERWKQELLLNFPLQEALLSLVSSLLEAATHSKDIGEGNIAPVAAWAESTLKDYWERFKQDAELGEWLDKWCKEIIMRIVEAEHYLLGEIVTDTLDALSDTDLNKFVEDKAGNDLQWIRINGSIVGGAIGLLLFLLLTYVYDPFVVPVVQGWFK
jgi:uncharacterized membrane-anchored protein YjiN (DUF445 family)